MPYADWSKRYACQKRWKQENRGKVRAQKQRARIKKKCLSKSLVVVLEDCCKKDEQLRRKLHQRLYQRNRKRMTKTDGRVGRLSSEKITHFPSKK